MIEKIYSYSITDEKTIERIVIDENVNINHMVLPKGKALPVHDSNSNVYMTVLRGILSITLGEQQTAVYHLGTILAIPEGIKMFVRNEHDDVLELLVVKAPAPGK